VLPDGSFVVTDYKTGKIDGYSPKELKSLSQKLQWALYSLAVQKIMDAPVQSFEYFFPSARGGGVVRSVGPLSEMELRPVIERLVETYNSGYFIQAANDSACSYCDFKRVCGDLKERKEEVKQKFTSPSDQLTRVFSNWEFRSKMGGVE
jgi:CRISPR/Cas system-associated exonuclease Cas4 (RecB family)